VSYWNLARVEEDLGNGAEAEGLVRRAHAIWLARLGSEHPHTRMAVERLARRLPLQP
jgi:hypothetical protein